MAVKIRLQRHGRKKRPFYQIVIADSRSPRDGKFIENIGIYNPMTKPATIELDREKAIDWLLKGAQPTDTARAILRFKGVMYHKHLLRGVKKGALTQEEADKLYQDWIATKDEKISKRVEESAKEKAEFLKKVSGEAKVIEEVVEEVPAEEEAPVEETTAEAPTTETEEAPVEEAPAKEDTKEE